ncbi:hypothetical protein GIB67_024839, partial [Kingdonia uniflora]
VYIDASYYKENEIEYLSFVLSVIIAILDPHLQVSFYRSYNMTVGYIDEEHYNIRF